ncbi:alpha/beta hydrolase [Muriicola soli]|uniref:Esterase family protein n=1 Tax=Muriicola soli TaxID=2507538 RepID=A0A411EC45_9FLAO|nr:alpha/beta hydrolase-fold protein [Muriicola soli]QBA65302.1 esterase family protein [Muriicola soli]
MIFNVDHISLKGSFFSNNLKRKVRFRLVAPPSFRNSDTRFPVLLMNDGQDFTALRLEHIITEAYRDKKLMPFLYVGLETDENRMKEYGTSGIADYKGRGDKADLYSLFVTEEFIPFLKKEFRASSHKEEWVFCGMSLGGLSAFDIVYNHPGLFGKAAVFSGSFWWRKKAYTRKDPEDRSRIVLDMVKEGDYSPHLSFWFMCGTHDEKADRNHNGVIDSIDDTMDLIKELQLKGYTYPGKISYVEIPGGKHDLPTWSGVFPLFLKWAFPKKISSAVDQ